MPHVVQPPRNDGLEALLRDAHAALDQGDVRAGRATSQKVLKAAEGLSNPRYEAKALLCLAHCDRMLSHYRRAHRASQRAAQNFQLLGDTSGEVMALSTHAIVSVTLGRNEEAVEAALLSVRLSQFLEHAEHSVLSYNALGVAYFWSHGFEKAEQALSTAIEIAEQVRPRLSTFQPKVNLWWTELLRVFHERYYVGTLTGLDKLRRQREAIITLISSGDAGGATAGTHITTEAVLQFGLCLEQCWHGRIGQARLDVEVLAQWAKRYDTVTWLGALESWARAEIAWAQSDWSQAMREAAKMIDIAVQVEHEQLACLGHLLSSQMYVAQGLNGAAVDELRRLRLREQLIRADGLETREKVVEWQVDLRLRQQSINQLKHSVTQLQSASVELTRLSLEDSLTAIPNRRNFEIYAATLLRQSIERGQSTCLALIDVDRFKQINDGFSHLVGDAVLREIARTLKSHVRELDMAARLGGDEFVIIFKNAELRVAERVCERIVVAVRTFDWNAIAPSLAASISIGVAQAESGDTIETLTDRADAAMYHHKKRRA
ncbi:MAG: GGDEF domain-containing protein [Burkholderiaceae bacterium]